MKYLKIPQRFTDDEKELILNVKAQYGRLAASYILNRIQVIKIIELSARLSASTSISIKYLEKQKLL